MASNLSIDLADPVRKHRAESLDLRSGAYLPLRYFVHPQEGPLGCGLYASKVDTDRIRSRLALRMLQGITRNRSTDVSKASPTCTNRCLVQSARWRNPLLGSERYRGPWQSQHFVAKPGRIAQESAGGWVLSRKESQGAVPMPGCSQ